MQCIPSSFYHITSCLFEWNLRDTQPSTINIFEWIKCGIPCIGGAYTSCIRAHTPVPRTICAHKFEHLNLHFVRRTHTLVHSSLHPRCIRAKPSLHSSTQPRAFEHTPLLHSSLHPRCIRVYILAAFERKPACTHTTLLHSSTHHRAVERKPSCTHTTLLHWSTHHRAFEFVPSCTRTYIIVNKNVHSSSHDKVP
jgi:hypothetical protein